MADVQSLLVANEKLSDEVLGPGADQIDQSRRFPREVEQDEKKRTKYEGQSTK